MLELMAVLLSLIVFIRCECIAVHCSALHKKYGMRAGSQSKCHHLFGRLIRIENKVNVMQIEMKMQFQFSNETRKFRNCDGLFT